MGRPRLTFKNSIKDTGEGQVKSMRILRRACMKRLLTVDEAKETRREELKNLYGFTALRKTHNKLYFIMFLIAVHFVFALLMVH